jgi:hypothetical protein
MALALDQALHSIFHYIEDRLTLEQALHSIFHYIEDSFSISQSFTFNLPLYRR